MSKLVLAFIVSIFITLAAIAAMAQDPEQQPGKPLYLPPKEYQSDLAPETDPNWKKFQQEQDVRKKEGKPTVNPYEKPVESIYESETHYEIVDDNKYKKQKPPQRWGD